MSQLVEQQRAKFALDWVKKNRHSAELEAAVSGLPAMILMNGLGQASAYAKSQNKAHWTALYRALSDWLCKRENIGAIYAGKQDLMAAITQGSQQDYRAAQTEALAFLQWLKSAVRAAGTRG